jgi:hypothetical protein
MGLLDDLGIAVLAALLFAGFVAAMALGCALWARRLWRRRRAELALRAGALATSAGIAGMRWLWTRPTPDRRWWTVQRARRRLARSVTAASSAVALAKSTNASTGDLGTLCRRLTSAAADADRSLRAAQEATTASDEHVVAIAHANSLARAAERIHRAAAQSMVAANAASAGELLDHVELEATALDAGTALTRRARA